MQALLDQAGWGDAAIAPLAGDASTRRYLRLTKPSGAAVLMDAPPGAEAAACPPDASPEDRARLGYNAMARLAGPNAAAFAGIAQALTARGHSAPHILAADLTHGFLLLEDLGDAVFTRALDAGADAEALYGAAIDVLAALRRSTMPRTVSAYGVDWSILTYDPTALQTEADLFLDWYVWRGDRARFDAGARADWHAAWAALFPLLADEAPVLSLRDVHADNLIWLPEREGSARAGLLDFQDALFGHPAYDLVSLLKDARRDVDAGLAEGMVERYCTGGCVDDQAAFRRAYRVLGVQRNAKILGIFIRLSERDGKTGYTRFLPRVARLFLDDLADPVLADLRGVVDRLAPDLAAEARA